MACSEPRREPGVDEPGDDGVEPFELGERVPKISCDSPPGGRTILLCTKKASRPTLAHD